MQKLQIAKNNLAWAVGQKARGQKKSGKPE
jgi:hypothetical protein